MSNSCAFLYNLTWSTFFQIHDEREGLTLDRKMSTFLFFDTCTSDKLLLLLLYKLQAYVSVMHFQAWLQGVGGCVVASRHDKSLLHYSAFSICLCPNKLKPHWHGPASPHLLRPPSRLVQGGAGFALSSPAFPSLALLCVLSPLAMGERRGHM